MFIVNPTELAQPFDVTQLQIYPNCSMRASRPSNTGVGWLQARQRDDE